MARFVAAKTKGLADKAVKALLWPLAASLLGTVASWVVTGDFNESEVRTAIGGAILSAVSFGGAYFGSPGKVDPNEPGTIIGTGKLLGIGSSEDGYANLGLLLVILGVFVAIFAHTLVGLVLVVVGVVLLA